MAMMVATSESKGYGGTLATPGGKKGKSGGKGGGKGKGG
jgi:hypothetical protein